jgi:acyl-CoA thioesterase I
MARERSASDARRRRMLLRGVATERDAAEAIDAAGRETIDLTDPTARFEPVTIRPEPPPVEPLPLAIQDANRPWRSEVRRLVEGMQPLTWVFTGDDATQAAVHTHGRRGYVELFDQRIRGGLRRLLDVVVNTGLEGGRAAALVKSRDWRIDRFQPDVVSLAFGTADSLAGPDGRAAFEADLRALVATLVDVGIVTVLNTPHRPARQRAAAVADLPAYVRITRSLADELGVPLVDHWAHWRDPRSVRLLAADGLHPNAMGHRELARLLEHELGVAETSLGIGNATSVDRTAAGRQNTPRNAPIVEPRP